MKKLIAIILILSGLAVTINYSPLKAELIALWPTTPCAHPLTYQIANIDPRFNISKQAVEDALAAAEHTWEGASGKDLFQLTAKGTVQVSLIYDSRQDATNRLKSLGLEIDATKANYEQLKTAYQQTEAAYSADKLKYDTAANVFKQHTNAYEQQVDYWNSRGGAPKSDYENLQKQKAQLAAEADSLNASRDHLNQEIETLNAMANELNRIAHELNLDVKNYNTTSSSNGEEFQEGIYRQDEHGQVIEIYQYDSTAQLQRVLAHELGHALGLEHVNDPDAIMYRLNESSNDKPTAADLSELAQVCSKENNPWLKILKQFIPTR